MPYIFGYGSLIEQSSRLRTTPKAIYVLPATVTGFARGWWARTPSPGFSTTFAGAIPADKASINGVVYAVTQQELEDTNKREDGYTPTDVTGQIQILSGGYKPKDKVWMYVNKFKAGEREKSLPSASFPIVQSYVDICLTGCLQIEAAFPDDAKGFAREFIKSTQAWSNYWENDRINPRRPFVSAPAAFTIDTLLKECVPEEFSKIQLAPGHWR
ncbi:MAG TPA: gamma-glutamylcyclotransferase family protein [Terracidiphilus sp.]|nr:gamma-glutamylcyclotransferase family protein [Terracidiphilus sp.]